MSENDKSIPKNNYSVSLRNKTSEDYEAALNIYNNAYYDVVVEQFGPWDQEVQNGFFIEAWEKPEFKMIVSEGAVCGFIVVEDCLDGPFINEIVIDKEYQGKGIGSYLIRQIKESAGEEAKSVRLEVLKNNTKAKKLYVSLGFIGTGESATHYKMKWVPRVN